MISTKINIALFGVTEAIQSIKKEEVKGKKV